MAWVRVGDDAASNGTVLAVLEDEDADERSPEEVFGYVMLLASVSAVHYQDYAVSLGQAIQQARSRARAERLLGLAHRAGYGELQRDTETGRIRFLLKDDPNFIHMITKAEKDWTAQRKADNSNPVLVVQVRRRDGDACRYCQVVVNFDDRKGNRGGTYDHRPPGAPAANPDHLVVACKTCNSARGEASQGLDPQAGLAAADELLPLQPTPPEPYFKTSTVPWLEEHRSILLQYGLTVPPRPKKDLRAGMPAPGSAPAPANGERPEPRQPRPGPDPAPANAARDPQQDRWEPVSRPGSTGSTPTKGGAPGAPQEGPQRSQDLFEQIPADGRSSGSGYAGAGRVGTGRAGTGQDGDRRPTGQRRSRRSRRGGRNRTRPQSSPQPQTPLSREDHTR